MAFIQTTEFTADILLLSPSQTHVLSLSGLISLTELLFHELCEIVYLFIFTIIIFHTKLNNLNLVYSFYVL